MDDARPSGAGGHFDGFVADDPDDGGDNYERAAYGSRTIPFGERTGFTLYPIYSEGVEVGWGADCGKHKDADTPHLRCRARLWYGVRQPVTEEQAVRGLKRWLLYGTAIATSSPTGKTTHMLIKPRACALEPDDPEEDLEKAVDFLT